VKTVPSGASQSLVMLSLSVVVAKKYRYTVSSDAKKEFDAGGLEQEFPGSTLLVIASLYGMIVLEDEGLMFSSIATDAVRPPAPLPVTVNARSPRATWPVVAMVNEVVPPELEIEVGEKENDAPDGKFETLKLLTGPGNAPEKVLVMVKVAFWPWVMIAEIGAAVREKVDEEQFR
jgi:hypothetical protein